MKWPKRLISLSIALLLLAPISPAIAVESFLKLDVMEVTWPSAKPMTVSREEVAKAISEEVTPSWRKFTNFSEKGQDRTINVQLGEIYPEALRLTSPMSCGSENFANFVQSVRELFYNSIKISDTANRSLVILAPNNACVWSGRATIGNGKEFNGLMVLQDTASPFVLTHEVGHLLGLGHSNLLRCSDGAKDGAWSSNCRAIEYGGSVDVMGNVVTDGPLSIYHQWRLGLVDNSEIHQSWISETLQLSAVDTSGKVKGIFLRDGSASYWIEYRRPTAAQSFTPGLVIYRTDPPPFQFVDVPQTDEVIVGTPGLGVTTDMWMLNLDSFTYSQAGQASGSMTLSASKSATLYSGNVTVTVTATEDPNEVSVSINRRVDNTPPPTPVVKEFNRWISPDSEILEAGFEDRDSAISDFQLEISGRNEQISNSSGVGTVPTYLDPLNTRKTLRLRDLPEGEFEFRVRSRDVWGNISAWSAPVRALIDRSFPLVGSEFSVHEYTRDRLQIKLDSFSDKGSGLCRTSVVNEDGWVIQSSQDSEKPLLSTEANSTIEAKFETFDCLGNGLTGSIRISNQVRGITDAKRTGKWSSISTAGVTGLRCQGKCTASLTVKDNIAIVSGEGSADVLLTGKVVHRVGTSSNQAPRISANLKIGRSSKILRISGRDFSIFGFVQSKLEVGAVEKITRSEKYEDLSTIDVNQSKLSKFGFREGDFSNPWLIAPMDRGTTLLDPSLDLCGAKYKSESGRQFRRQMIATKPGSPYIFLSSEVVKYSDKSAGEAALSELRARFQDCIENKGAKEDDGIFVDYSFAPLPNSNASLVAESSRVLVRAQIGKGITARQLLAFYQFKGEMFTGLYVVKAGEVGFDDAEVKRWFEVASRMASRLETKY